MMKRCFVLLSLLGFASCHRPHTYDAEATVERISPVRKDENGRTLTVDVEVAYAGCPGKQIEVARGDATLASCVSKYSVGAKIPVQVEHYWTDEGHYTWGLRRIGDCPRVRDPADEASYALVRECGDVNVNGTRVGFECSYVPRRELLRRCPWFKRR
jgi:hypothetical protein